VRVAAVVPTLDEQDGIAACLAPLVAEAARVIVVDGGSGDETVARALEAGAVGAVVVGRQVGGGERSGAAVDRDRVHVVSSRRRPRIAVACGGAQLIIGGITSRPPGRPEST